MSEPQPKINYQRPGPIINRALETYIEVRLDTAHDSASEAVRDIAKAKARRILHLETIDQIVTTLNRASFELQCLRENR